MEEGRPSKENTKGRRKCRAGQPRAWHPAAWGWTRSARPHEWAGTGTRPGSLAHRCLWLLPQSDSTSEVEWWPAQGQQSLEHLLCGPLQKRLVSSGSVPHPLEGRAVIATERLLTHLYCTEIAKEIAGEVSLFSENHNRAGKTKRGYERKINTAT